MKKQQRTHSPQFKAEVVLESFITGNVAATANRNKVHDTLLRGWRREFRDKMHKVFGREKGRDQKEMERMERIIGKLTIEKEILKKTMALVN
jgi:transposase-like protein